MVSRAEVALGRYSRTPDCSLGIGGRSVEIYYSSSFWAGVPIVGGAAEKYFDDTAYAIQRLVFSSDLGKLDGDAGDASNTVRFFRSGIVRSDYVEVSGGIVLVALYVRDTQSYVNVNLLR